MGKKLRFCRKDIETLLKQNEERFRVIFENAPVGVALSNSASGFLLVNPHLCKMLEYTEEELLNTGFLKITYPDDLSISQANMKEAEAGLKDKFNFKKRYITKTGRIIWANVAVSLLKNTNGKLKNYLVIFEDITKKIEAEKELAKVKRKAIIQEKLMALGTMSAGIAHEINQPLNSLKVNVDSILYLYDKLGEIDEKELIKNLTFISEQAERINQIISNVRSFIQRGKNFNLEACDINQLINSALTKTKGKLKTNNIFLKKSLESIPNINGNKAGIENTVVNLVNNSIHAFLRSNKKRKEIIISTYSKKDNIYLEVSDNAIGIEREIINKIFDPFFTTTNKEGMGLGLTMVQWTVSMLNGEIEMKNNSLGGVTCKITIPIQ